MLTAILKNPAYAGAFVYGRTRSCHSSYANGKLITERGPMSEWKTVVKDLYPAHPDWERFKQAQAALCDNYAEYQLNARHTLEERIRTKDAICRELATHCRRRLPG